MKKASFTGTGVALITPFENGKIDFSSLEKLIHHVIDGGVDYVVTLGTTGETPTLTAEERQAILSFTVKTVNDKIPVVAGFGGNNTLGLVHELESFDLTGISAVLSSSPSYNKPTQRGILAHYWAVADASPVPVILYNVPGRTCSNITADTSITLSEHPNIIGIKEASGDIEQATEILRQAPDDFLVISGDDPSALSLISVGGHGVISVIANALPKEFSDMISSALRGDMKKAQELNKHVFPIHEWLYVEGNPVGIKEACHYLGFGNRDVRLPLVEMTIPNREMLYKIMREAGY